MQTRSPSHPALPGVGSAVAPLQRSQLKLPKRKPRVLMDLSVRSHSSMEAPTAELLQRYDSIFNQVKDQPTTLSGACARERWSAFGLPADTLLRVWSLSDSSRRGALDIQDHRIAMVRARLRPRLKKKCYTRAIFSVFPFLPAPDLRAREANKMGSARKAIVAKCARLPLVCPSAASHQLCAGWQRDPRVGAACNPRGDKRRRHGRACDTSIRASRSCNVRARRPTVAHRAAAVRRAGTSCRTVAPRCRQPLEPLE